MRNAFRLVLVVAAAVGCAKSASSAREGEVRVNLSKIATLLLNAADRDGRFPEAPPCRGDPPTNAFSVPSDSAAVAGGASYTPQFDTWDGPWSEIPFATTEPIHAVYCYAGAAERFSVDASLWAEGLGRWVVYRREGIMLDGRPSIGPITRGVVAPRTP